MKNEKTEKNNPIINALNDLSAFTWFLRGLKAAGMQLTRIDMLNAWMENNPHLKDGKLFQASLIWKEIKLEIQYPLWMVYFLAGVLPQGSGEHYANQVELQKVASSIDVTAKK